MRIEINQDVRSALQDKNWASPECMQRTEKDFNLTEGEPPSDKGQPRPPDMFNTIRHSKIGYNAENTGNLFVGFVFQGFRGIHGFQGNLLNLSSFSALHENLTASQLVYQITCEGMWTEHRESLWSLGRGDGLPGSLQLVHQPSSTRASFYWCLH